MAAPSSPHLSIRQAAFIGVTDLIHEPASMLTLLAVLLLSIGLDLAWKRSARRTALT